MDLIRSLRFQIMLWVIVLISAVTLTIAEYAYSSSGATIATILTGCIALAGLSHYYLRVLKMPNFMIILLKMIGIGIICYFIWTLLVPMGVSQFDRAFSLAHLIMMLIVIKFFLARTITALTQIFMLSLLLMIIAGITYGEFLLAPLFVLYMFGAIYTMVIYNFQRHIEDVSHTRFFGQDISPEHQDAMRAEVNILWNQLGIGQFKITFIMILVMLFFFSGVAFLFFPRLDAGSLLGSNFGSENKIAFNDKIKLGTIDKNNSLRQWIGNIKLSRNNRSLGSASEPYYLRFNALMDYKKSAEMPALFYWNRPFIVDWDRKRMVSEKIVPDENLIVQEIWLNPVRSSYIPGTYPIEKLEGIRNEVLGLSQADNAIIRYYGNRIGKTMHYKVASFAEIDEDERFKRFQQDLELFGERWFYYHIDIDHHITERVVILANSIAKTLLDQRADAYQQMKAASINLFAFKNTLLGDKTKSTFDIFNIGKEESTLVLDDIDREEYNDYVEMLFITSDVVGEYNRHIAQTISDYLRVNYTYTKTPPDRALLVSKDDKGDEVYSEPIDAFLSYNIPSGNCEYFSSAMVLLCRSVEVPARIAVGYLAQEYASDTNTYTVRQRDAHSWVEVLCDHEWSRFDPTPPSSIALAEKGMLERMLAPLSHYFEAIRVDWLDYIASGKGKQSLQWTEGVSGWLQQFEQEAKEKVEKKSTLEAWFKLQNKEPFFSLFIRWFILFELLVVIGICISELWAYIVPKYLFWRKYRFELKGYTESGAGFYREMLCVLGSIEIYKSSDLSAREFAFELRRYGERFKSVGFLCETYYQQRFSTIRLSENRSSNIVEALTELKVLVRHIKRNEPKPWPWHVK